MENRAYREATPDDVQGVFDAIETRLKLDAEIPQETAVSFGGADTIELMPINGLKRFALHMRPDAASAVSIVRETPQPDLGPTAYKAEAFRLRTQDDGTPTISVGTEVNLTEEEPVTLSSFKAAREREKLTGQDRVSAATCHELVEQISRTRVTSIRRNND